MLTVDQLNKIAFDRGYQAIADSYTEADEVWRELLPADKIVVPSTETLTDYPYGDRKIMPIGLGELHEIEEGQRVPQDLIGEGPVRQCKLRTLATALTVTEDMLMLRDAETRLVRDVIDWGRRVAGAASRFRNDFIAGMFQKGTLAAGSTKYFNNAYRGTPDSNAGFIYDGKPWFAASGNAHPAQGYTGSVGSFGENLIATAPLTSANVQTAYSTMSVTNAYDERYQPISIRPTVLLAGGSMRQTVAAITESDLLPGGSNNDANAFRGLLRPVIWDRLTDDTDAWWMLADDPGMMVYDSGIPEIRTRVNEATRTVTFEGFIRFGAVITDWRGAICANKATS
jgi:hypothetical protein